MPSTVGLWGARPGSEAQGEAVWLGSDALESGAAGITLTRDVLLRAGLEQDEDLLVELTGSSVRLTGDRLRKVYVEATSCCNLACATCIRNAWDDSLGHMPVERFQRLLQGLPQPRAGARPVTLSLSGFGEPLVHPQLLDMVRIGCEQGLPIEIVTNGLLLDAALARAFAELGVSQVAVSLDGADPDSYASVRGAGFGAAAEAARLLVEARRRTRRPMAVGAAFVATRRNVDSLPGLLRFAQDLQLDFVSVSNVVPHTAEMAAETLWRQAAWATTFRPQGWRPQVMMGHLDVEDRTLPALVAIAASGPVFPPSWLDGGAGRNYCRFVREGMLAVRWDGCVSPCLSLLHTHPEYVNDHWKTVHSHAVGHVDERGLAEIWRDAAYRELRTRVRSFDFSPCFACGGCPDTDTNESDCYGSPFPACGECLWAQGIVLCP